VLRTVAKGAVAFAAVAALTVPGGARAPPPPNDDRTSAAPIPTFPATIAGTVVGATVERLDPQVSQCGRIEATVWYRIDQAPDGTIVLGVRGAGLAPVVRVYRLARGAISELDCASARSGARAQVAFGSVRGASFLVVVGKRPGTAEAAFTLDARLFLPPENDARRSAQPLRRLPASVRGSTLGATSEASDPKACGLAGGSVWYAISPGAASRILFRLHANGDLDASLVVLRRIRSQVEIADCARTDRKGDAIVVVDVDKGAQYLVAVGQREGSPPGDFVLQALAAQAPERAPGHPLPARGARATVNGLTNVNDVYWVRLVAGTTYRIAFSSRGCAELALRGPHGTIRSLRCSAYTTFTPGPDGGGRYVLEVTAPRGTESQPYRLQIAAAGPDDLGVGLPLANLATAHGTLSPGGIDVLDLYHFDVGRSSDVRLRLGSGGGRAFSLLLLTDTGGRVAAGTGQIRRRLGIGRYVVAVRGEVGTRAGRYALSLVIRQLTSTSLTSSAAEVVPGSSVTFRAATSPPPDGGAIKLEIDRFDPLTGWQFSRLVRLHAPGGSLSWTPPAAGRWRARASFLGTLRFSPSRSGYVFVLVATPIG
jgi:hypothetical protein